MRENGGRERGAGSVQASPRAGRSAPELAPPPRSPPPAPRSLDDHPLYQLTRVRIREFVREPGAVFWTFVFPVLLAAGLGLAFRSRPPEVARVGVVAGAGALAPAELAALAAAPGLRVVTFPTAAAADQALGTGTLAIVAVSEGGGAGTARAAQYRYDPARPDARTARLLVDQAVQRGAGRRDAVAVRERAVREPGSRYIDFFIPGLLGFNLMGGGIWGVGFAIVTARSRKLLKRLAATPMSRAQYLASFLLSRLLFLVVDVAVVLGFGALVFGVPVRGSLVQVGAIALLGGLAFGGLGLLVASRARTVEGVSGLMNVLMMPMWVFSGVFFSSENFPAAVQPLVQALPLTAVNDALRATMLRGAGWGAVAPELAIVGAWTVASYAAAVRLFRWR